MNVINLQENRCCVWRMRHHSPSLTIFFFNYPYILLFFVEIQRYATDIWMEAASTPQGKCLVLHDVQNR